MVRPKEINLLEFLHAVEKLKYEMRHSHLSSGDQESVAEHCWRVALMAVMLLPEIGEKLDGEKCIKMALIHDLSEIFAGDVYALNPSNFEGREENERKAMIKLAEMLPDESVRKEIFGLWDEYEALKTREAQFVRFLDKLEVLIQHNEGSLDKWDDTEKKYQYGMASKHAEKFGFLPEFAALIDKEMLEKLKKAGLNPQEISEEDYLKFFGRYFKGK